MRTETCFLTIKDYTILEAMCDRRRGDGDPLVSILKRKIGSALVVLREDMPVNVATLNSRIVFSIDRREPEMRVLSHECITSPIGMVLPISTPQGLALLGLAEGQDFLLTDNHGREERVVLEKVYYQPESAQREKDAAGNLSTPAQRKPALTLIRGALNDRPRLVPTASDDFDDPGPSAA